MVDNPEIISHLKEGEEAKVFTFNQGVNFDTGFYSIEEDKFYINLKVFEGMSLMAVMASVEYFHRLDDDSYVAFSDAYEIFDDESEIYGQLKTLEQRFRENYEQAMNGAN